MSRLRLNVRNLLALGAPALIARMLGVLGVLLIGLSLLLPWFSVPAPTSAPGEPLTVAGRGGAVVTIFKLLTGATLLAFALAQVRSRISCRGEIASIASRLLVPYAFVLLFFPYSLTMWSPEIAGRASALHAQHESLVSTNGDLYLAQEDKDTLWRQRVVAINRPMDSVIVRLPDWGPHGVRWSRLFEVTQWFGASSWFASFVAKGWVAALVGATLVLFASAREEAGGPLAAARRAFRFGAGCAAGLLVLALIPPAIAVASLARGERAVHHARAREGRDALRAAANWMPTLRADGRFLRQLGMLAREIGDDTDTARLWEAAELETRGLILQSRAAYLDLLARPDTQPGVARECGKALLRQAIDALNSGELNVAAALLTQVLTFDPCNVKALHTLQLTEFRRGESESVRQRAADLATVYRSFNHPTKAAVLANAQEVVALAQFLEADPSAAWATWRLAKRR